MRHLGSPYKAVLTGGQASVCVSVGNDVDVAGRKHPSNFLVEMRVQVLCRWLMLMGLCCLRLISMRLLLCILLYRGILPTPGLPLREYDNRSNQNT